MENEEGEGGEWQVRRDREGGEMDREESEEKIVGLMFAGAS